jgi:putative Mn2+ efflux pump MntP
MSFLELLLVALGLSLDAFAVALAAGTHERISGFRPAFRLWFHFGLFQSLMTMAGWFLGTSLESVIKSSAHWVAFALLFAVGAHMVWEGCKPFVGESASSRLDPSRGLVLISLSVATSLDALAVGIGIGCLGHSVWYPGIVIGLVAALMSLIGVRLGRMLSGKLGKKLEIAGGIILFLIAMKAAFSP